MIIGGTDNRVYSNQSMIFGSYATTNHDNTLLFNFTQSDNQTSHEKSYPNLFRSGYGINTTETFSDGVNVSGKVIADKFVGDGTYITNIMDENSMWVLLFQERRIAYF